MYFVYVIYNQLHNKIYIGQSENLQRRIYEHNDPLNKTHRYTSMFSGEWKLVYSEQVDTRQVALKREKQLKSCQGRKFVWGKVVEKIGVNL